MKPAVLPRLCVDCVHYHYDRGMADSLADPLRCLHPALRDTFGTDSVPASWARGDQRPGTRKRCGHEAAMFEPVPDRDPPWLVALVILIIFAACAAIIGVWPHE